MNIPIVSFDPSLSNFGICLANVNVETLAFTVEDLILVASTPDKTKQTVRTSDQLARAKASCAAMVKACEGRAFAITEIPFWHAAQFGSAIHNAGLVTGILAAVPIPLIEVLPRAVKLASVGSPQASKEEMIEWGVSTYPNAPWLLTKRGGQMVPTQKNEHLADAIAAGLAGLKDPQFLAALGMYRSMSRVAA